MTKSGRNTLKHCDKPQFNIRLKTELAKHYTVNGGFETYKISAQAITLFPKIGSNFTVFVKIIQAHDRITFHVQL